jgi:hypothetical protein
MFDWSFMDRCFLAKDADPLAWSRATHQSGATVRQDRRHGPTPQLTPNEAPSIRLQTLRWLAEVSHHRRSYLYAGLTYTLFQWTRANFRKHSGRR